MKLNKLGKVFTTSGGRMLLKIKKYSPELLLGAGFILGAYGLYSCCKATLKLPEIIDKHREDIDILNSKEELSDMEYTRKLVGVKFNTAKSITKNYVFSGGVVLTSAAFVLTSFGIIKGRNIALTAVCAGLKDAYDGLYESLKEEVGEEKAEEIRKKSIKENTSLEVKDENDICRTDDKVDLSKYSVYAKFFDEMSRFYENDPNYNYVFLKAQQKYFNDILDARGHVFLNEVYDALDIPRTPAGAVVGWVKGLGDDYIDFGFGDFRNKRLRDFVNGYEPAILLDFNVDGIIYDKI